MALTPPEAVGVLASELRELDLTLIASSGSAAWSGSAQAACLRMHLYVYRQSVVLAGRWQGAGG